MTRAEASDPFRALGGEKKRARRDRASGGGSSESDASDGSDSDAAVSSELGLDSELSDASDAEASLRDAFAVGQIVRCVVLRLDKGKSGGKRVELATRLSAVVGGEKGGTRERPARGRQRPRVRRVRGGPRVRVILRLLSRRFEAFGPGEGVFTAQERAESRDPPPAVGSIGRRRRPGREEKRTRGGRGLERILLRLHRDGGPRRVANAVTHESDATSMATLLPGMLVNARVRESRRGRRASRPTS